MHWHVADWLLLSAVYGVLSLTSFLVYAWDKCAARSLHLLDLMGGWLAQKTLRHKCSKPAFQRVYALTVLLNIGLLSCQLLRL